MLSAVVSMSVARIVSTIPGRVVIAIVSRATSGEGLPWLVR